MPTLNTTLLLLFSLCFLGSGFGQASFAPANAALSAERLAALDRVLNQYVADGQVAGGVALIAHEGEIGYLKAFGSRDIASDDPMETDDIFRIASMTKAVTVVGIMTLFEDGYFKLDDPLARYIPEFADMQVLVPDPDGEAYTLEKAKAPITIRDLLNHTSGLTYDFFGQPHFSELYTENKIYNGLGATEGTIGDMVKRLAQLPLVHHPGEGWQYGMNMDVLGYLIEVLSGKTFDDYLRTEVFAPLGMNDTHFYLPTAKLGRAATLYGAGPDGRIVKLVGTSADGFHSDLTTQQGNPRYFAGGAGLVSTAEDYFKFLQMLLNGGVYDDARILSRKTVELITSEQTGDRMPWFKGHGFGFGFAISRGPEFTGNPGSRGTFSWLGYLSTYFWADPEEQLIGILLTQLSPNYTDMNQKFKNLLFQAIED